MKKLNDTRLTYMDTNWIDKILHAKLEPLRLKETITRMGTVEIKHLYLFYSSRGRYADCVVVSVIHGDNERTRFIIDNQRCVDCERESGLIEPQKHRWYKEAFAVFVEGCIAPKATSTSSYPEMLSQLTEAELAFSRAGRNYR